MICMAYLSTATCPPTSVEVDAILAVSQRNNLQCNVTGMLCHYDGSYLQFLEGANDDVEATFNRIAADRRHGAMLTLYRRETSQRLFAEWSMGLVRVDAVDPNHRAFCKGLRDLELEKTAEHAEFVEPFLSSFRAWIR